MSRHGGYAGVSDCVGRGGISEEQAARDLNLSEQGWLDRLLPKQAGWIRVHSHQLMTLPRRRPHTLSSFSPPHPVRRARVSSCLSAAEARPGGRSA